MPRREYGLSGDDMCEAFATWLASQGRLPFDAYNNEEATIRFEIKHDGDEVDHAKVILEYGEDG